MENVVSYWFKGNTCQAQGLLSSKETEILSASDSVEVIESESKTDLDQTYEELDAIKQRLLVLRSKIIYTPPDPCEQPPLDPYLSGRSLQLEQLRRSNRQLNCQLQRSLDHLRSKREELIHAHDMHCQLTGQLRKMRDELQTLAQFRESSQHQFGLCIERNELIKMNKMNSVDFFKSMQELTYKLMRRMKAVVPIRCHLRLRNNLAFELILIRIFLQDLYEEVIHAWHNEARRIDELTRHSSGRRSENSNQLLSLPD